MMMNAEEYLRRSRVFRRLKDGLHGPLIERYTARLVEDGLARQGCWRSLNVVDGLLSWNTVGAAPRPTSTRPWSSGISDIEVHGSRSSRATGRR